MKYELPDEIVARFRASALERISVVDQAWSRLTNGDPSIELEREMHRQVHTLKGDARVVGFTDVNHLCQKLEDLLFFGSQRGFRVPDDIDYLVTMSLQFVGMLIRKKMGASLGGIDLAGFTRQIEEALRDAESVAPGDLSAPRDADASAALDQGDRLSAATRQRMAHAATSVFVESLRVPAANAERLRATWRHLVETLRALDGTPLDPILTRHRSATAELSKNLGRKALLEIPSSPLRGSAQLTEAVDVVLLHGIANAVDHGIEPPEVRAAAGKPDHARIQVTLRELPHSLELTIQDDGGGVDVERVRRRAEGMGLLDGVGASQASPTVLLDFLFHPHFSTREQVGEVSGRGIGLNAVRAALTRIGGTVELRSERGRGTALCARLPRSAGQVSVHRITLAGSRIPIALPANIPLLEDVCEEVLFFDLEQLLGIPGSDLRSDDEGRILAVGTGAHRLRLVSRNTPALTRAERLCPTHDDDPFEVISAAGIETLLIRPAALLRDLDLTFPTGAEAPSSGWLRASDQ